MSVDAYKAIEALLVDIAATNIIIIDSKGAVWINTGGGEQLEVSVLAKTFYNTFYSVQDIGLIVNKEFFTVAIKQDDDEYTVFLAMLDKGYLLAIIYLHRAPTKWINRRAKETIALLNAIIPDDNAKA